MHVVGSFLNIDIELLHQCYFLRSHLLTYQGENYISVHAMQEELRIQQAVFRLRPNLHNYVDIHGVPLLS